jgi:hypothetical protein
MNMPLQIYDFIAVLFPATILLTILRAEQPGLALWQQSYQFGNLAVLLVIAYIVGQFLTILSGLIERWSITRWLFFKKKVMLTAGKMMLNGRKSPVVIPVKVGESILEALSDLYGFPVEKDEEGIFDLVYAPVHDRMAKRDMFLALANMMRTLVVLAVLVVLYYHAILFIVGPKSMGYSYLYVLIAVIAFFVFRKGYDNFKRHSEAIPYSAFLAWYKQQKMPKS